MFNDCLYVLGIVLGDENIKVKQKWVWYTEHTYNFYTLNAKIGGQPGLCGDSKVYL